MSFRMLSDFVVDLQQQATSLKLPAFSPSLVERASLLAMSVFPELQRLADVSLRYIERGVPVATAMAKAASSTGARPELLNVAALALSMQRLTVHVVGAEVAQLCDETDVHDLPDAPPRLLRDAWLVESADPALPLVGDIVSVGGYAADGGWFVVALGASGSSFVAKWQPVWGEAIVEGTQPDRSPLIAGLSGAEHQAQAAELIRLVSTLGLLLDAEGAPVRHEDEQHRSNPPKGRPLAAASAVQWTTRHVHLASPAPAPASSSAPAPGPVAGTEAVVTPVRGFLRMQPHGPGGSLRKLIWVERQSCRAEGRGVPPSC